MRIRVVGLFLAWLICVTGWAQPTRVPKTNSLPVLVHYMPWFETRATTPTHTWGLHWTMANQNPDVIVDAATGRRQIASHYYPLIGPYASSDPDVMEYHLLLMRYAGIDGLMIDFYGNGGNDLPLLLRNTNALVPQIQDKGLAFGMVFEDQFAATRILARQNMGYIGTQYMSSPNYVRTSGKPLVGVFGPQRYQTPADWTSILDTLPEPADFVTLWYESQEAGANATGEFSWVYSDSTAGVRNFYVNRASTLQTAVGSAFPSFNSFYAQGGCAGPTWQINPRAGQTLQSTLALATQYATRIKALQLVTWNDFGEGTMLEPTLETSYSYLERIQAFTGVSYTVSELTLVHRLYIQRKRWAGDTLAQAALSRASDSLTMLRVPSATAIIDSLEGVTGVRSLPSASKLTLYPNPAEDRIYVDVIHDQQALVVVRTIMGQVVLSQKGTGPVDVSALKAGLYQLEIWQNGCKRFARFNKL